MSKKLLLDPILDCLAQIWAPKFFCGFYIRHCSKLPSMKFQGKVMNQTWEKDWNASFGPDFDPDLVLNIFFVSITSTRCYALLQAIIVYNFKKTNEPDLRKWQKI